MMRKELIIILVFVFFLQTALAATSINNCTELQDMQNNLTEDYVLDGNINCSGFSNFEPVGNGTDKFRGTFDGQGFNITGLSINCTQSSCGLFGQTAYSATYSSAKIKNVGLIDVNITGNNYQKVGSLVGFARSTFINNTFVTGIVTSNSSSVGGLVGYGSDYFNIWNSYTESNVTTTSGTVGGIIGNCNSGCGIHNSYATGTIRGRSDSVGGLAGSLLVASVFDSYATGNVIGNGSNKIGGLVGTANMRSSIRDSYATGTVTGSNYVGGLVGYHRYNSHVVRSYSTGNVTGNQNVGGLVGYAEYAAQDITDSYATGTVKGNKYIGGLLGGARASSIVIRSYSIGEVIGGSSVGGLVGFARHNVKIINSYAAGSTTGNSIVGGLIGNKTDTVTVDNSFWDICRTGQENCTGDGVAGDCTGKNDDGSETKYFYTVTNEPLQSWNFSALWDDGCSISGYAQLQNVLGQGDCKTNDDPCVSEQAIPEVKGIFANIAVIFAALLLVAVVFWKKD